MNTNTQKFQVTAKSRNAKTGPIMVTITESTSCPDVCPFKGGACYAKSGPLSFTWRKVDKANFPNLVDLNGLCQAIASQKDGALWRMNQAGDLPGWNNEIDADALEAITAANRGRRGFTYTHKPMTRENAAAVRKANDDGFTVNLSANNLSHADELAETQAGPVVTVLPSNATNNVKTPAGRTVVVCPATQRDNVTCASCGLCQRQRKTIVGFPAHGAQHKKASAIAQ